MDGVELGSPTAFLRPSLSGVSSRPGPGDARGGSVGSGPGVARHCRSPGPAGGCGVAGKELKGVSSSGLRPAIRKGANGEWISLGKPAPGACRAGTGRSEGRAALMLGGGSAWAGPRQRGRGDANSWACTTALPWGKAVPGLVPPSGGEETARRGGTERTAPLGEG